MSADIPSPIVALQTYDFLPAAPITDPLQLVMAVRDIVANHPDAHNQRIWTSLDDQFDELVSLNWVREHLCGTTFCTAGWMVTLAGHTWISEELVTGDVNATGAALPKSQWSEWSASSVAEEILSKLELPEQWNDHEDMCDHLFFGYAEQSEILEILDELIAFNTPVLL